MLIVDGYNVLYRWPELAALARESLEHARDRLVAILADYGGRSGEEVVVVFDAQHVPGGTGSQEGVGGVLVVYSREGETADQVIERMVAGLRDRRDVRVATSDGLEQGLVLGLGAARLPARELYQLVQRESQAPPPRSPGRGGGLLADGLAEEVRRTLEDWRRGVKGDGGR